MTTLTKCPTCNMDGLAVQTAFDAHCPAAWAHDFIVASSEGRGDGDGVASAASSSLETPRDADLLAEMAAQATMGHHQFCLGVHEHEGGECEWEWISWKDAFARLAEQLQSAAASDASKAKEKATSRAPAGDGVSDEAEVIAFLVDVERGLGSGSAFVPADSEAASHLHGVITRAQQQLDVVIAGLYERTSKSAGLPLSVRPGQVTGSCGHEIGPYWADDPRSQTITKSRTRDGRKSLCYATDCEACRWSWEKAGILFKTPEDAEAWLGEPWKDRDGDEDLGELVR